MSTWTLSYRCILCSGKLIKTSTISTSVTDPNKTYNFVVLKGSILQVCWSYKQKVPTAKSTV